MTTVVVFGGAGFLGRRLVDRLATEGMTVRVAVRRPVPKGSHDVTSAELTRLLSVSRQRSLLLGSDSLLPASGSLIANKFSLFRLPGNSIGKLLNCLPKAEAPWLS
jgi:NAD dependent epimerase/dehydratase family enzyme